MDSIGDKSDLNAAVQWLIDRGEEDHGGAVEFKHCPHLDDPSLPLIDASLLRPGTAPRQARQKQSATTNPSCVKS